MEKSFTLKDIEKIISDKFNRETEEDYIIINEKDNIFSFKLSSNPLLVTGVGGFLKYIEKAIFIPGIIWYREGKKYVSEKPDEIKKTIETIKRKYGK